MADPNQFYRFLFYFLKSVSHLYRTALMIFMICVLGVTNLWAGITWKTSETEFDYSVSNLSFFFYSQNQYSRDYNQQVIKNETSATYGAVAEIQVSEFENIPQPGSGIQTQAMAMGPDNGTDPPDGLKVQAFLSTVATGLNDEQGVDIDLQAVSRVIRRFEVNQPENYSVKLDLTGLPNFDDFFLGDEYQAFYSIQTEVILEQIVGTGDQMEVQPVPGFPVELDEANRTATVGVELRPTDDQMRPITYRIKTELKLASRIDNFQLQGSQVLGDVNGNYQVGSPQAPFALQALLRPAVSNANSALNLLLLLY